MNIVEAISSSLTEVTQLTEKYIGRIFIHGTIKNTKPVDVRIKKISIPLKTSDINFIYDKIVKESDIHKYDSVMENYYPIGSIINMTDGMQIKVMSYGELSRYNDTIYVDIYGELVDDSVILIENIRNNQIEDRVKFELNRIVESNEIVKNLLPQYDANWIKFSDDDINAIEKFNAMNVLSVFDNIDYDERVYLAMSVDNAVSQSYTTLPDSVIDQIKELTHILAIPKIRAGFMSYHASYNPRYVFEGIIYIYDNMLLTDETLYDKFYLLNKLDGKCEILISHNENQMIFTFNTPNESVNNYVLTINNYNQYGPYRKYNIESIDLVSINKETLERNKIPSVSENQSDYLEVCTQIFSIISASNYDGTLSEYYDSIETLFNNINTRKETNINDSE